ncbi:MAG: TatD family hydrolase [Chitinophagaceae bacterium]|nr:TatD family hydrolase [Chitinophagaceae bacterium]
MIINIHSNQKINGNTFAIQHRHNFFDALPKTYYSAGLLPENITEVWPTHFTLLEAALSSNLALAISGCGLNKNCVVNWQLQQQAFSAQVKLANKLKKPLLVNADRASDELMLLIWENQNTQTVIFYTSNTAWPIAEKLLAAGYWLSFNKNLRNTKTQEVFLQTPLNRIFFFSDDAAVPVEELYQLAAEIKALALNEIILQLELNFKKVFKIPVP